VCTQAVGAARGEAVLDLPGASAIHLFVVGTDGRIVTTERVPVR
jgi:hypothetical protein